MDMQVINETEGDQRAGKGLVRVVVAGASGFAGQELIRLLARHPSVTITAATGSQATSAPRRLPALAKIWDGTVVPLDPGSFTADAVFLARKLTAIACDIQLQVTLPDLRRRRPNLDALYRLYDSVGFGRLLRNQAERIASGI